MAHSKEEIQNMFKTGQPLDEFGFSSLINFLEAQKGPKGDTGPKGDAGPQGEKGLQGPKGDPGKDGIDAPPVTVSEMSLNVDVDGKVTGGNITINGSSVPIQINPSEG